MKFAFLFIDGVGLAPPSPDNPVNPEVCPALCKLIHSHCKPIDANLGVAGLPQSATGQATMFTGVNAPQFMGRHCEGFPGPGLRDLIGKDNLFLKLKARGKKVKFADAYLVESADELESRRFKSVTTVMALTAPETVSTVSDLSDDNAVLQCFEKYMSFVVNHVPTYKEYVMNLNEKMNDKDFLTDMNALLHPDLTYDPHESYLLVKERLIDKLPGDRWQ